MQAVLLAGGQGTRLRPYTISFPKPLVPLGNYPIIEIIIRQLCHAGIDELIISTGHLAGLIEAYCGNGSQWGTKIRYVREKKPLNTAGALKLIDGLEKNFLVMNGDILTTLDYKSLIREHETRAPIATIATRMRESKIDFGVVTTNEQGFLSQYSEKPVYQFLVSMGVYVLNRSILECISQDESIGMPDLLLRSKSNGGEIYCMKTDCAWLDIGRADDYEKAQESFLADQSAFLKSV